MRVLVLGGSGMLGSTVVDFLARDRGLRVGATVRNRQMLGAGHRLLPEVNWHALDVDADSLRELPSFLDDYDWIINAIGVIKPFISDDRPDEVRRAIQVNALFPYSLAHRAEDVGVRVLQIATDCVFSGSEGGYTEEAAHHPLDVYGMTKSLGEVDSKNVFHLRCSIIGPEVKNHVSLLDWFLKQAPGSKLTGFTNHLWNGVTTLHFAKICCGIIKHNLEVPCLQHIVPAKEITKAEMLDYFSTCYRRDDIKIVHGVSSSPIDRTLRTNNPVINRLLWEVGGYMKPPSVPDMIEDLHAFDFRLGSMDSTLLQG